MVSKFCNLYSLGGTQHAAGKSDLSMQGVAQFASRPNLLTLPYVCMYVLGGRTGRGPTGKGPPKRLAS